MPETVDITPDVPRDGLVPYHANERLERLLPRTLISDMTRLGVEMKAAGIVSTDLGFALASKQVVLECLERLQEMAHKSTGNDLHLISASVTRLAKAMSVLASKNIVETTEASQVAQPLRRSFAPGQHVNFHYHKHVQEEPNKGSNPAPDV